MIGKHNKLSDNFSCHPYTPPTMTTGYVREHQSRLCTGTRPTNNSKNFFLAFCSNDQDYKRWIKMMFNEQNVRKKILNYLLVVFPYIAGSSVPVHSRWSWSAACSGGTKNYLIAYYVCLSCTYYFLQHNPDWVMKCETWELITKS